MSKFSVSFIVPGVAVPKARPRVTRRNGKAMTYTPEKTVSFENLVSWTAQQAMKEYGCDLNSGPLRAEIGIALPVPSSWGKKVTEAALNGSVAPTKKPDMDNILKALFDAMNGIVFKDDSQVVEILSWKFYAATPETRISIVSTDQEAAK